MNILQIHKTYWPRDGASNYMLSLSAILEARGHTVIPFSTREDKNLPTPYEKYFVSHSELQDPSQVTLRKKIAYTKNIFYSREARKNMAWLLRDNAVDVAHLHNIYHHISPSILPELKKKKIPIVMTLHDYKLLSPNYSLYHHGGVHEEDARGWYTSCIKNKCIKDSRAQSIISTAEMIWHHKIMKYFEKYVDQFIAPSQFMFDLCMKYGWDKSRFVHIPYHIEDSKINTKKTEDGEYVAYVGRLSEEKGVTTLIRAAAHTPNIQYKIIGTGPEEKKIKKMVENLHLLNVQMTGFKTGSELEKLIQGARIIAVPSVWYENYPLSIMEAKAAGKIVVGSRIGGIPELLPDVLLCKPGDAPGFAHTISHWYEETASKREAMGKKLQKQVAEISNEENHAQQILGIYEESMKKYTA